MDRKEGYITEVEYVHGVYREQGPSYLNFVLLLQSRQPVALERGFTYCDLGCGQGDSVNLFAACHPEGEFHGIDFNYAHIAGARNLAHRAELSNVIFWEASFADLEGLALPQFDFVVLHGIYSWVDLENRQRILAFLKQKLKPGGVVFLSYNSQAGWGVHAPVRHLLCSYAETQPGPLEERVEAAIRFVRELKASRAAFFEANPSAGEFFEYVCTLPRNYLVHEFFNRDWTLFYHADVVRQLAAAELSFVGAAHFAENQDMLRFSAPLQQALDGVADRVLRETIKDFAVPTLLRRDVFARQGKRILPAEQLAHVDTARFALVLPQAQLPRKALFPIGEVILDPERYDPILFALEERPQTLGQLLTRPEIEALGNARLIEALMVLLSAGYLMPAVEPAPAAVLSTGRLNLAILEGTLEQTDPRSLAAPVVQNAVKLDWIERLLLWGELQGSAAPFDDVWQRMEAKGYRLERDGVVLESPEEQRAELARLIGRFSADRLPLLRQLGVMRGEETGR